MGSFQEYLNKKGYETNNTAKVSNTNNATNNTESGGSFSRYLKEREEERKRREREEQERKAKQEANKAVENFKNTVKNSSNITELQKAYSKLSTTERAELEKEAQEKINSNPIKSSLNAISKGNSEITNKPLVNKETIEAKEGKLYDIKYLEPAKNKILKPAGAFKDGYQIGDVSKTIVGTLGDAGTRLVTGIGNIGEGIADKYSYIKADVYDKLGNTEKAQSIRENAMKQSSIMKDINRTANKFDEYSILGGKAQNITEGLGYMAGLAAMSGLGGEIGTAIGGTEKAATIGATALSTSTTFSSSMGNAMTEAYSNGATDEEALKYGIISGVAGAGSELLFGGIGKGTKAIGLSKSAVPIDDVLAKKVSSIFESRLAKNLAEYTVKTGAEGVEEVVSGLMQAIGQKITYMSEEDLSVLIQDQNLLEQFIDGVVVSGIASSPALVKTTVTNQDYVDVLPTANNNQQNNKIENPTVKENIPQQTQNNENISQNMEQNVSNNENIKQKQLEIINNSNPMSDDYHTGIRDMKDIKTFEEVINDEESFVYGDFSKEDAEKALQEGKITVYSSKPIEQGGFVSTSQNMAKDYAGNGKIYSKEVNLQDVAWINGDEGQYAKVENTQNIEYNTNESESGINEDSRRIEQDDKRRVQELFKEYERGQGNDSSSSQELRSSQNQQNITESTIKQELINYAQKYEKSNLTEQEKKLKNIINKLGGNVVFYELGENNIYPGLADTSKFYIDTLGNENIENVFYHELTHYLRQNKNPIYMNEIQPIAEEIASDFDFQEVIFNYAQSSKDIFDIRKLDGTKQLELAEEVIADYNANIFGNLEIDYELPSYIKDKIKLSMNKILNGEKIESSMTNNQAPSTQNNVLRTSERYAKQQNKKQEQEQIAKILEEPAEKVSEKNRAWAIAKANIIDKGIVFEELSRKTNNRELQGKWDATLSATAKGQNAIGLPRYEFDSKTKTQKLISKSLEDIRTEIGDKTSDFQNYMYHQLNIDRMTLEDRFGGDTGINYERTQGIKNKPVFGENISAEYSRQKVAEFEKNNPEFKTYAKDVYDYLDANMQELVDKGVVSKELKDKLKEMYPHYVPIKRVEAKGLAINVPLDTNRTGINSPLKKATGGSSDIQPLFQTIADRTLQTYKASARNNFGVELMNTLQGEKISSQTDVESIINEISDPEAELLKEGENGQSPTFTVFDKGEKLTFEITKDMYDALKPQSEIINQLNNNKIAKGLNKISNFRRGVLTEYNPIFSLTNALKDAQDIVGNSQHAVKTYTKFPEAYVQIIKKGYWYNEYIQNGGEQNSYFKDGEFTSDKKELKLKTALKVPLKTISSINNVIEMAPRLAEYIASREKGTSIETSMLNAARVTTNFKAGGDLTKTLNRNGATFLNASVQGFQQQIRNIQEANAKGLKGYAVLACKYAIQGIPVLILNGLMWEDDDDYENLQDYVKDNYYVIAKYGDGKFIRLPKGRVSATIQKIIGNVSEYLTDDNKKLNIDNVAKDFWEDLKFAQDNLAPNNPLDNNTISPIIDVVTNTSWYGEDLVPKRLQDKPVAEQYDETTDSLSIWLGDKLNVSPYKINYLLDQYGGGVADIVLPKYTKQAENNVFTDKFTTDSVMKSKYAGEFYDNLDKLKVNANSSKATDEDILKYKYASSVSSDMSKLYQEKREIQNSNISDNQKKEKLRKVQKQINELAETALTSSIKISGNTATIGDDGYYKSKSVSTGEMEWNKITDEEADKNKNISLKTYTDYKNKISNETINQRQSGDISEKGQLKDKDKIQILVNASYSAKETKAIYENYILSSEDSKYPIIKDSNININEYLKYKMQNFEADKEDDGTVQGKSISGSKKNKVWNYINNMSINYTQKVILYGLEYEVNDSDKTIIRNYIDNMKGKTKQEKLDMISKFAGVTVYKNGTYDY